MIKYLVLICFVVVSTSGGVSAQESEEQLVKKDGSVIRYTKKKLHKDHIEIRNLKKEKIEIPNNDILGYCNERTGLLEYEFDLPRFLSHITLILEGRIKVYRGYTAGSSHMVNGMSTPTGGSPVFYSEKNGMLKEFGYGRKDRRAFLDTLLSDAMSSISYLESFISDDEVIDIFREYNLQFFKNVHVSYYRKTGTLQFYTHTRSQKPLVITVNDSLTYTFKIPQVYPLIINIPVGVVSKICVSSDNATYCDLLSPSICDMRYFEVQFNERRNRFDMEIRTKDQMQKFLIRTRDQ
jgi:hypothetical protein